MSQQLFSLHSWPRAIVHIDGDAFFTSCEEAIHPELKGETRRHLALPLLHIKPE